MKSVFLPHLHLYSNRLVNKIYYHLEARLKAYQNPLQLKPDLSQFQLPSTDQ